MKIQTSDRGDRNGQIKQIQEGPMEACTHRNMYNQGRKGRQENEEQETGGDKEREVRRRVGEEDMMRMVVGRGGAERNQRSGRGEC